MKKNILLLYSISLTLTFITFNSCNTTEPTDELKPGRRDYTWTVDTLFLPFNSFTDITGTSPTDLWVCSPGDADKIFYHYNGNNWSTDNNFRVFSPFSISSLNSFNIWSGGSDGRIWHYKNGNWSENYKYSLNTTNDITFQTILTLSSNNLLVAGKYYIDADYWGIILSYDGNTWKKLNISKIRTGFAYIKHSNNNKIYFLGLTTEQTTESRYQFYEYDGSSLKEIYSGSQSNNAENGRLLQLGSKTYFIIGYDFYNYNGQTFIKIGRLSDDQMFLNAGIGRNEQDVFLGMRDGIAHYNGENTIYLYQTTGNVFVRKGILFEKEVFFLGRDTNGNNLIFHGKLNK
ncbi:MAG: hypothetical protein LC122_06740 [Chitinophagales bacterium]|nr:hypothetical protein [Chitinophagales bacterium]